MYAPVEFHLHELGECVVELVDVSVVDSDGIALRLMQLLDALHVDGLAFGILIAAAGVKMRGGKDAFELHAPR